MLESFVEKLGQAIIFLRWTEKLVVSGNTVQETRSAASDVRKVLELSRKDQLALACYYHSGKGNCTLPYNKECNVTCCGDLLLPWLEFAVILVDCSDCGQSIISLADVRSYPFFINDVTCQTCGNTCKILTSEFIKNITDIPDLAAKWNDVTDLATLEKLVETGREYCTFVALKVYSKKIADDPNLFFFSWVGYYLEPLHDNRNPFVQLIITERALDEIRERIKDGDELGKSISRNGPAEVM
ncbi:MAG: hypothetical protein ACFFD4_35230 [Candidatus Odinarchaeota archaeon]